MDGIGLGNDHAPCHTQGTTRSHDRHALQWGGYPLLVFTGPRKTHTLFFQLPKGRDSRKSMCPSTVAAFLLFQIDPRSYTPYDWTTRLYTLEKRTPTTARVLNASHLRSCLYPLSKRRGRGSRSESIGPERLTGRMCASLATFTTQARTHSLRSTRTPRIQPGHGPVPQVYQTPPSRPKRIPARWHVLSTPLSSERSFLV